jgi:Na+-transporting methylmalonyl-CoA/oxaloacetate decarboxylase gamma subunit
MKQLLSILIIAMFATTAIAAEKKTVASASKKVEKKEVKKHKKAEASMKVADDKPKAPAKKKK